MWQFHPKPGHLQSPAGLSLIYEITSSVSGEVTIRVRLAGAESGAIRSHPSIQGYVITEFTDINSEVNGLMDMWRQPKVYAAELARIQQPDVILGKLPRRNFQSGDKVELDIKFSHYSENDLRGVWLSWFTKTSASGRYQIQQTVPQTRIAALQSISFLAPAVDRPQRQRVFLELRGSEGSLLAENSYEYFVFPEHEEASRASVGIAAEFVRRRLLRGYQQRCKFPSPVDRCAL